MTAPATYERIARLYDAAPETPTPRAKRAYRLLAAYVDSRYFGTMPRDGWRAAPVYHDGLPDIEEARRARVIPVYDLQHDHPCLSDAENYRFRAVHDLYGHDWAAQSPLGFGVENERIASDRQLVDFWHWYRDEAPRIIHNRGALVDAGYALRGEIYGQACYYEARGVFPKQKAFLLSLSYLTRE